MNPNPSNVFAFGLTRKESSTSNNSNPEHNLPAFGPRNQNYVRKEKHHPLYFPSFSLPHGGRSIARIWIFSKKIRRHFTITTHNELPSVWFRSSAEIILNSSLAAPGLCQLFSTDLDITLTQEIEMVRIWCIDNSTVEEDERGEHHSSQPNFLSLELVKETTGLMYWKLNTDTYEADGILDKIREDRGYTFDFVTEGSEEELPIREQWLRTFFSEHKRTNEEMRYIIGGTGYYDIRVNPDDNWIRIELSAGDLIVLPAGLYRRFTFDSKNYVKIRRFYIGEPKWPLSHIPYHEVDIVNAGGDGLENSGEKKTGVQDIQRRSSTTSASAAKAIQSLKGRETSLGELEDSSAKLEIGADNFASASHQLMLKYKDKKWYQF